MPSQQKAYEVKSGDYTFHYTPEDLTRADMVRKSEGVYHLITGHLSVLARVIQADMHQKKFVIEVDGTPFEVKISDELDQMLETMGFGASASKHLTEIRAPMPGLVIDVAVEVGQAVSQGDKVLILEAMKMENSIMVSANATIKAIHITKGQTVDKGQVLVELE
jgi:biotin carboxyl carrier protein